MRVNALEKLELQLEKLRELELHEIEGQLEKLERAFFKVSTFIWFVILCENNVLAFRTRPSQPPVLVPEGTHGDGVPA